MVQLYAESFAPWCEKARWALDHHRVPYHYIEHVPLIGEPRLRLAARRRRGRVTVPLLIDGRAVLMDSVGIARFAEDRRTDSEPLFPPGSDGELTGWNERSEAVMTSGRALLLGRMLRSPPALREQLPPFVPGFLRPLLQPVAAHGVRFLVRKYEIRLEDEGHHLARIREALDHVRRTLSDGRSFLLNAFSFADITVATSLQFILPVADRHVPLGSATREVWTHPTLPAEYEDLLAWRDALYASKRPGRAEVRALPGA